MHPLLILTFVGAAGEFHPQALPALQPGLPAPADPDAPAPLPSPGLSLSPASLTCCLTLLPAPSSIHFRALFGEARKGNQVNWSRK